MDIQLTKRLWKTIFCDMDRTNNGNLKWKCWMQAKSGNFKSLKKEKIDMQEELGDLHSFTFVSQSDIE